MTGEFLPPAPPIISRMISFFPTSAWVGRFYEFLAVACWVAFLNFHKYFFFAGREASLRSRPSADKNIKNYNFSFLCLKSLRFSRRNWFWNEVCSAEWIIFFNRVRLNTTVSTSLGFIVPQTLPHGFLYIPALEITEVFLDHLKRNLCAM